MGIMDDIGQLFAEQTPEATANNAEKATVEATTVTENATTTVEASSETVNTETVSGDETSANETPSETAPETTGSDSLSETPPDTPVTTTESTGQVNLFGELTEEGCGCAVQKKKPKGAGGKKKEGAATGSSSACAASKAKPEKPKEPDQDMERLVVITTQNEQRTYPSEMTLEEIRADIERDFPAFSKESTNWHFEKQEEKGRYLCIPTCKFNKAG